MKKFKDNKGWEYEAERTDETWDFSVKPSNEEKRDLPPSLFKYYAINDYSIDALENQYLYASDRWQLNDPFDCHKELVDFNNYSDDDKSNILKSGLGFDFITDQVKRDFENNVLNKDYLVFTDRSRLKEQANANSKIWKDLSSHYIDRFFKWFHMEFFKEFGVISLTENANNILMWAHYTGNIGYALEFDFSKFDNSVFHGPFQVGYRELLEPCCHKEYRNSAFLYQSIIKSRVWGYEKEWRFLAFSKSGINITGLGQTILSERKFSVPLPSSITLASGFINYRDLQCNGGQFEITLSGNQLRAINHALHSNMYIFWIVPPDLLHRNKTEKQYNANLNQFDLTRVLINIKRKVANTFYINIVD